MNAHRDNIACREPGLKASQMTPSLCRSQRTLPQNLFAEKKRSLEEQRRIYNHFPGLALDPVESLEDKISETKLQISAFIHKLESISHNSSHINIISTGKSNLILKYKFFQYTEALFISTGTCKNSHVISLLYYKNTAPALTGSSLHHSWYDIVPHHNAHLRRQHLL